MAVLIWNPVTMINKSLETLELWHTLLIMISLASIVMGFLSHAMGSETSRSNLKFEEYAFLKQDTITKIGLAL